LRVRGRGLPSEGGNRGDLYALLTIVTPDSADADEQALWKRLAEQSSFNPRKAV
jgi:curved DNA-binding protein